MNTETSGQVECRAELQDLLQQLRTTQRPSEIDNILFRLDLVISELAWYKWRMISADASAPVTITNAA